MVNNLVKSLPYAPVVVYDNRGVNGGGNCWYNIKRCWQYPLEQGATHRLIICDDAELCDDFVKYATMCINKFPDAIWTFYNGSWIKDSCKKKDTPYTLVTGGKMGGLGICLPVEHIEPMIRFTDSWLGRDFIHDDGRVCFYALKNEIPVMCCIPSLMQHIGTKSYIPHHNNPNRVSRTFRKDVSEENWDSDEYNVHPWVVNDIWLPQDHPRKAAVERVLKDAKDKKKKQSE